MLLAFLSVVPMLLPALSLSLSYFPVPMPVSHTWHQTHCHRLFIPPTATGLELDRSTDHVLARSNWLGVEGPTTVTDPKDPGGFGTTKQGDDYHAGAGDRVGSRKGT